MYVATPSVEPAQTTPKPPNWEGEPHRDHGVKVPHMVVKGLICRCKQRTTEIRLGKGPHRDKLAGQ